MNRDALAFRLQGNLLRQSRSDHDSRARLCEEPLWLQNDPKAQKGQAHECY